MPSRPARPIIPRQTAQDHSIRFRRVAYGSGWGQRRLGRRCPGGRSRQGEGARAGQGTGKPACRRSWSPDGPGQPRHSGLRLRRRPGGPRGAEPRLWSACRMSLQRPAPPIAIASVPEAPTSYRSVQYASVRGRGVLVTGGASGIGAEMVRAFVAQGAAVQLLDMDRDAGPALAAETGARFHPCNLCDLCDIPALRAAVAAAAAHASIDVLVNNAGREGRPARAVRGGAGLLERAAGAEPEPPVLRHPGHRPGDGAARPRSGDPAGFGALDARPTRHGRMHHCQGGDPRPDPDPVA